MCLTPRYPRDGGSQVEIDEIDWQDLPIYCPHCGNQGKDGGVWEENGWTPFRLLEEVVRSWLFTPVNRDDGLSLIADVAAGTDPLSHLQIECGECFGVFPLPEKVNVRFD